MSAAAMAAYLMRAARPRLCHARVLRQRRATPPCAPAYIIYANILIISRHAATICHADITISRRCHAADAAAYAEMACRAITRLRHDTLR